MPLYHGTRKPFGKGGLVLPGKLTSEDNTTGSESYTQGLRPYTGEKVYVTTDLELAKHFAKISKGRGKAKVFEVLYVGSIERDDALFDGEELCDAHYRQKISGKELRPLSVRHRAKAGEPRSSYTTEKGYVVVYKKGHENAWKNGYMFEHVFVMSEMLGRPLTDKENVHHKNGVRCDNRPENLELWSTSQPYGQRVRDKIAWAREILDLYGDLS